MSEQKRADIVIIGAGIIGCSLARELSRYDVAVCVLEMESDVSCGATSANSGIIHGGYDARHGSVKSSFSRQGNQLVDGLNKELNFGYHKIGSFVLAFDDEEVRHLEALKENGEKNGVSTLKIISREEILEMEPHISKEVVKALYCREAGVVSPYEYCIALAENAIENGCDFQFDEKVTNITKRGGEFIIDTPRSSYASKLVANCAGINSAMISNLVNNEHFSIIPRRGEYILLKRGDGSIVNKVVFQCPTAKGKGILVTPTLYNNLLLGPNAQIVEESEDMAEGIERFEKIVSTACKSVPDFKISNAIRLFAGLRATSSTKDFVIGESETSGFFNIAGIDSPGLTSSPAIAKHVANLMKERIHFKEKSNFKPNRPPITSPEERDKTPASELMGKTKLPLNDPKCVVCRCERVNSATIRDALSRGMNVTTLDGLKRRTRACMGMCQSDFCKPRVRQIVADYYRMPVEKIVDFRAPLNKVDVELIKKL